MDEAGRNKLWTEYHKTKSADIREQLILEYAPLVKLVAGRLSMYLGFNVEYDDLVGYGIFGLIDAIDKFDLMKDVKFETYASLRIRGAILDQIKKVNTRVVTPLIVLSCTAIIAIFTYFKHYPAGDFFIIVFASVVIFLVIGLIIEKMLNRFLEINYEKALAERLEAERLEEEARAAMEAEGGEDIGTGDDQEQPPQF